MENTMDTARIRRLRAEIKEAALYRAMQRPLPNSRRKGQEILSEKLPQRGWFDLTNSDHLRYAAELFGVSHTDEDFAASLEARSDIGEVDRLILSGWTFDATGVRKLGSRKIAENQHEFATEVSCRDPEGNRHYRNDIPVPLHYQDAYADQTFPVKCTIWVWPDGRWEIDLSSVKVFGILGESAAPHPWHGEDLAVTKATAANIKLKAALNREAV